MKRSLKLRNEMQSFKFHNVRESLADSKRSETSRILIRERTVQGGRERAHY